MSLADLAGTGIEPLCAACGGHVREHARCDGCASLGPSSRPCERCTIADNGYAQGRVVGMLLVANGFPVDGRASGLAGVPDAPRVADPCAACAGPALAHDGCAACLATGYLDPSVFGPPCPPCLAADVARAVPRPAVSAPDVLPTWYESPERTHWIMTEDDIALGRAQRFVESLSVARSVELARAGDPRSRAMRAAGWEYIERVIAALATAAGALALAAHWGGLRGAVCAALAALAGLALAGVGFVAKLRSRNAVHALLMREHPLPEVRAWYAAAQPGGPRWGVDENAVRPPDDDAP